MGQLIQAPESPRNLVTNVSGLGGFSIMTSPSINVPGQNLSSQVSSNLIGHLPHQQALPSVIGKSNNLSNIYFRV